MPKQLALNNSERIVPSVALPMRLVSVIASPVVRLLSLSIDLLLRGLGIRPSVAPVVTGAEIKVLIEQGTQAGMFEEAERNMVEGVFELGTRRVNTLMTPRQEVVWLDLDDSPEEIRHKVAGHVYSRFPVGQESLDNTLGIVQAKDLLARSLAGQPVDLKASLRSPLFVPASMSASKVLEAFKKFRMQMALVVDEYGVIQGLITLNDILAAIVGDVSAVDALPEPQALQREDGSWLLDGMVPVEMFKKIFHIEKLPGEEKGYYYTLGGFVMMHMEHVPSAGQHFEWGGLRFEVVDMDVHRVDKVLVAPSR